MGEGLPGGGGTTATLTLPARAPLFDETHFTSLESATRIRIKRDPHQTGFTFASKLHAHAFLWTFLIGQILGVIGLLNLVLWHSPFLGLWGLVVGVAVNLVYGPTWASLCRTAEPRVSNWQWVLGGVGNRYSQVCTRAAWRHIRHG